jgi:hypothetical protein
VTTLARFRIKKKQRTLNLERSVNDLAGRAEELEREAADLRRENGWLKEIVMLKGSRFSAGASGSGGVPQEPALPIPGPSSISQNSRSNSGEDDQEDGDNSSDEDYTEGKKKKSKARNKRS